MSKKHRGKQRYQTFITVVVAALTLLLRLSQFTSNKHGSLIHFWVWHMGCCANMCVWFMHVHILPEPPWALIKPYTIFLSTWQEKEIKIMRYFWLSQLQLFFVPMNTNYWWYSSSRFTVYKNISLWIYCLVIYETFLK